MRSLAFCLAAVFLSAAHAQPTLDDYGALPEIQNVAVSPNGELIAYRSVARGNDIVRVVSLKDKRPMAGVDVSLVKPRDVFFVNNEQVLLRAAENRRVKGFTGKFDVSTLYALDIATGDVKQLLVPGDGVVFPGQTGLGQIVGVSPDRQSLFMPAYYGEPTRIMGHFADPPRALLRVPLQGAGKPRRIAAADNDTDDFFVDDDGQLIALEVFNQSKNLHQVFAMQGSKRTEIYTDETEIKNRGFVGVTADRKGLVVLDTDRNSDRRSYFTMSLATGEIDGPFYGRDDADIEAVIPNMQRVVQGVRYSGLMPTYRFFDDALDQRVKDIQAFFPDHSVYIVDYSSDWKHIVVLVQGSQTAGDYYLFSEGQDPKFIAAQRPAISTEDVNPTGIVTFAARDGLKIPTLIVIPRDKVSDIKNLPAVVMPHGGPASNDEIGFDYRAQALASQGYMVIMPQFRGSAGFGREHRVAGHGEWGRKMQDDVTDAVKFFADRGLIDSSHVCIVGASYGGYAALAGGAFTPELYKCVVSINGVGDLERFHNWVRNDQGRSSEALAYWEMQIGDDKYTPEQARDVSPEYSADKFVAPVLIIGSKADQTVPFTQSDNMVRALQKAGKDVEFVELEGDDHYLSFGETRTQALKATVEFINDNI